MREVRTSSSTPTSSVRVGGATSAQAGRAYRGERRCSRWAVVCVSSYRGGGT
jgi:hypothetical protein